jgi:hypothetical protein
MEDQFSGTRQRRGSCSLKKIKTWAGGLAQVIECLPCKLEALSSNPSIEKKRKVMKSITFHYRNSA